MSISQLTAALYARGCPEREGRGFDAGDRLAPDLPHQSLLVDELRRADLAVVFLGDSPAIVALAVKCPDPAEEPTPRHSSLAPSDHRSVGL